LIILAKRADDFTTRTQPAEIRDLTVRFKNAVLAFLKRFDDVGVSRSMPIHATLHTFWQHFPASDPALPAARVTVDASNTHPADLSTATPLRHDSAATSNTPE
jgi:hypothetical protein